MSISYVFSAKGPNFGQIQDNSKHIRQLLGHPPGPPIHNSAPPEAPGCGEMTLCSPLQALCTGGTVGPGCMPVTCYMHPQYACISFLFIYVSNLYLYGLQKVAV